MSATDTAVIGFRVVEEFHNPVTHGISYRHLSRVFHVRDAADQFCQLAKSTHRKCYVQEVMGMAEPDAPKGRRK